MVPKHGYLAMDEFFRRAGQRNDALRLPFRCWRFVTAFDFPQSSADVVLGMGGYVTVPGGLMAAFLRRPLVIHEQNSIAGMSNKVLAKISTRVLSGFPDVLKGTQWCGNPVRADIAALPEPRARYTGRSGKLNLLVVGGRLGAQALNEALPKALAILSGGGAFPPQPSPGDEGAIGSLRESPFNVVHQTGKKHLRPYRNCMNRRA